MSDELKRAIELKKQAEDQCDRMQKRWLDEKHRRQTAEDKAWELEQKLKYPI